ncbi:MAG: efflux RND transporter periplasmic adaptor subunit [Bacteroidetes bacterium]|nr:efflux RND transporter periplasmic adaptor subunit [Bacteroidota bacterium]
MDKNTIYIGLGFLVAGLLLGWIFFGGEPEAERFAENTTVEAGHEHEEGTVWTCSMHPQIRQDGPGQCPICGMDLIPLNNGGATEVADDEIQMSEAAMKIADVQTFTVQQTEPVKEIYLQGRVRPDETRLSAVTARFPGRLERLYVNVTGQEVKKGQKIASIYSPELVAAQKELLEAARLQETNPGFLDAAKNKLKLWNMTDAQIQGVLDRNETQYNFDIYSTQSGTVVSKNVNEGDYVNEGQPLLQVANLGKVWVEFDAYERDLPWIQKSDEITFSVQSLPGETFTSKITFIDPIINRETRVAQVRTEVNNKGGKLKPEMFAQGILNTTLKGAANAIVIPKSAVLWTGKRAVVYVKNTAHEQPTFQFREVILGPEAGNSYVVSKGLNSGEEVVANGVFRVDAAAQLQGKASMMNPEGGGGGGSMPGMPGMDMGGDAGKGGKSDMSGMNMETTQVKTSKFVEGDVVDFSKSAPAVFKKQLDLLLAAYLALKEALVAGDEKETAKASSALLAALEKVDGSKLGGDAKAFWDEKRSFLYEHTKLCKEADTIEGKRENFIYLSQPLIKVVEAFGANQTLYVDFCPMANKGKGAYWLSEVKEIRNPFMPEEMRSCGEVKDVIKK